MDMIEVQARLDKLVAAMLAKAMIKPSATVMLKSSQQPSVSVDWTSKREAKIGNDHAYEFFRGDDMLTMFDKADAWVAARPDPEQAKLNEFMAAVGAAADLGRELGIDAEFVNPLLVTMKSLSENALTYQGAAE